MGAAQYTVRTDAVSRISEPELLKMSTFSISPVSRTLNLTRTIPSIPCSCAANRAVRTGS